MTFATFLAGCIRDNAEVRLIPVRVGSLIRFYAHPQGGEPVVDYEVRGNVLIPLDFPAGEFKESDL